MVTQLTMRTGRAPPDPGFRPMVEFLRGEDGDLVDLLGVGKRLPGQRLAAEETPPAFLEIQPTCAGGEENLANPRMGAQPLHHRRTFVAGEIVRD